MIKDEVISELIECLESTANFVRGLSMERALPRYATLSIHDRAAAIDELIERVAVTLVSATSSSTTKETEQC